MILDVFVAHDGRFQWRFGASRIISFLVNLYASVPRIAVLVLTNTDVTTCVGLAYLVNVLSTFRSPSAIARLVIPQWINAVYGQLVGIAIIHRPLVEIHESIFEVSPFAAYGNPFCAIVWIRNRARIVTPRSDSAPYPINSCSREIMFYCPIVLPHGMVRTEALRQRLRGSS